MAQSSGRHGVFLPKGYLPTPTPLSASQLESLRAVVFDATTKTWVPRDVPLSDVELECWHEQSTWLQCPITGKRWGKGKAILGIGIYHAPRFLADAEKDRQRDLQKRIEAQRRGAGATAAAPTAAADGATPPTTAAASAPASGGAGAGAGAGATGGVAAATPSLFNVYPSVDPPPAGSIPKMERVRNGARMGRVEVIVGPVFDKEAYNDGINGSTAKGIFPSRERGIVSFDQQFNATNFVYHVRKPDGR